MKTILVNLFIEEVHRETINLRACKNLQVKKQRVTKSVNKSHQPKVQRLPNPIFTQKQNSMKGKPGN